MGQQLGFGFLKQGHNVKLGTRDSSKLEDWLKEAGDKASVGTTAEAAKFGDIIIIATGWVGTESAINSAGKENFKGKIVIDVTNPLDFSEGTPPKMTSVQGNSGGERVQKWLSESKVVKAFNTINAYIMVNPKYEEGNPSLLICGNNYDAKKQVTSFAENFGWKSVIDMGDISMAYWLECFAMVWIHYAFKNNHWTHAFSLLIK